MVVVSYSGKEINAKLVYYGAGLSGKTTNLESIYEAVPDTSRGKMVSMKTQSDRTLFFDLLPLDLGEIMGFKTRFLLYTVPGQVFYNATRKLVLKGADAIVFVADSEVGKMEENKDSLANLKANLAEYNLSLDNIPWVIQYNKRDLPNVYSLDELNAELNPGGKIPFFEAVAKDGKGVFETFRGISHLLMEKVTRDLRRGPMTSPAPMPQAPRSPLEEAARAQLAQSAAGPAREAMPHVAPPAPVGSGVDYGREIELPGVQPGVRRVAPAAEPAHTGPPAQPEPRIEPQPMPRPEPVHAAAPMPAPVMAAAPREVVSVASTATPVQAHVAHVLDAEAPPAPALRPSPVAETDGVAAAANEEFVVPVRIARKGTHEIVLRIVLKVED